MLMLCACCLLLCTLKVLLCCPPMNPTCSYTTLLSVSFLCHVAYKERAETLFTYNKKGQKYKLAIYH